MSEPYHQHLDGEAGDELKARLETVARRTAAKETERFWLRMIGEKVGRREFWTLLDASDALKFEFKYSPNGAIAIDVTMAALGKARFMWSVYRMVFAYSPKLVVLMHQENDPDFQAEPRVAPNAQGDE